MILTIKRHSLFIFLLILSLVPLFDLLNSGLPVTHDGQDHVARIANFYQNLTEGTIFPRWAANLNWGYGHPILMFLYPFPSYLASLFHFIGFTLVDSVKLVFAVSYILSGITMYWWIRSFLGKEAAFSAGMLYLFAPYRFVDLYVRGAIGEHVAFIFPPLVFLALLQLSKKFSYWYFFLGSVALASLILSHNAVSLMFLPLFLLYGLFLFTQTKNKKQFFVVNGLMFILGFSLSAFFWLPATFEGKYTLRDIVTKGEFASRFVSYTHFFYGPWNYGGSGLFTTQIGILHWIGILVSIPVAYFYYLKKRREWIIVSALLLIFVVTLFLMTAASKPIWDTVTLLQKFQFPWRLLTISIFIASILGAFTVEKLSQRQKRIFVVAGIVLLFIFTSPYWHAQKYVQKPESFFTSVYYGTTDTGESAPIWSVRFMERPPKAKMEIIDGNASVKKLSRTSSKRIYRVDAKERTRLVENTLYFPGWQVLVNKASTPIEFQDPAHRGLMTFSVDNGINDITIIFRETKLRLLANIISIGSVLVLIVLGVMRRKLW